MNSLRNPLRICRTNPRKQYRKEVVEESRKEILKQSLKKFLEEFQKDVCWKLEKYSEKAPGEIHEGILGRISGVGNLRKRNLRMNF